MDHATHTNFSRPHGEERHEAARLEPEAAACFETAASQPPQHEADRTLRWTSNMLCLWALCGKPACRRAHTCRRDPQTCVDRYAPLVPQAAGSAFALIAEGRQLGLGYDDLRAQAPDAIAAYEDWIARVDRSARPAPRATSSDAP